MTTPEIPKSLYIFIALAVWLVGCESDRPVPILMFPKANLPFDAIFEVVDTLRIQLDSSDTTVKFIEPWKIIAWGRGLLLLDVANKRVYQIDKNNGAIKRTLARKGTGPGEFQLIIDIAPTISGGFVALDYLRNSVTEYDQSGQVVGVYRLRYEHRAPELIAQSTSGYYIVSANRNLEDGSTMRKYQFLPYPKSAFLNIYTREFQLRNSFSSPRKEFWKTEGIFDRPCMGSFSPFVISGDTVISMLQNGYYEIRFHDMAGNQLKTLQVQSEFFQGFSAKTLADFRFLGEGNSKKPSLNDEEIGGAISSHSLPTALVLNEGVLIIKIVEPFDNYFPQYQKNLERNVHHDIFSYAGGSLKPLCTGLRTDLELLGSNQSGEWYFWRREKSEPPARLCTLLVARTKSSLGK
jgi:hypothetical protein